MAAFLLVNALALKRKLDDPIVPSPARSCLVKLGGVWRGDSNVPSPAWSGLQKVATHLRGLHSQHTLNQSILIGIPLFWSLRQSAALIIFFSLAEWQKAIFFALLATQFTDFVSSQVDCFLNYPRSLARERAARTTPLCTPDLPSVKKENTALSRMTE
jgi:hypothetical protein